MLNKILQGAVLLETISLVSAFPRLQELAEEKKLEERIAPVAAFPEYPGDASHALYNDFDASDQLVDVHGAHKFIAPGPGDIRGPCAGLNALANHGYIPRNGIATSESINTGLWEAFRLDKSATIVLETATRFFDGNPITGSWSIGYQSDEVNLGNDALFSTPSGICDYGHLKTEGDASITRGDFLAPTRNSNCASYPAFVNQLFGLAKSMNSNGWLTPRVYAQHQYDRKQHSIATNPNYFSPAYAGVAFTFGAHMFAFELLANHSAQYPRGYMTPDNFLSLWSYTRDKSGALQYTYGHERIPENYYRRATADPWTLNDIVQSTAQQCAAYPSNCQVGGNTGTVNSFSGVDLGDLTGGFVNTVSDLSDPAKMACFISQAVQADAPGFLEKQYSGAALKSALALIPKQLLPALQLYGTCPNLPKGKSTFSYTKYPGAKTPQSGPRATSE